MCVCLRLWGWECGGVSICDRLLDVVCDLVDQMMTNMLFLLYESEHRIEYLLFKPRTKDKHAHDLHHHFVIGGVNFVQNLHVFLSFRVGLNALCHVVQAERH